MSKSLKRRLAQGDLLFGTIITLPLPEVAEIMSLAGFDWLFVDLEHGTIDVSTAQNILQAASPKTPCMVRVPLGDQVWIKKCLDIGAEGVIVPQVQSPEEAERMIQLCKYPPLGSRSVGIARAQGYGMDFHDYIARANDELAVVLQIEHINAVENIELIAKIPGIDAFFIGPYDLSGSMGKTGKIDDPEVQEAISRVTRCARKARIPLGIFGTTVESVKPYIAEGYKLIAVGVDTMLLAGTAKQTLSLLR